MEKHKDLICILTSTYFPDCLWHSTMTKTLMSFPSGYHYYSVIGWPLSRKGTFEFLPTAQLLTA